MPSEMSLPRVIFVMGAPGAQKHSQMAMIVEKYGYFYLSAGDLVRSEMNNPEGEADSRRILIEQNSYDNSDVIAEITCRLLEKTIDEILETSKGSIRKFLIDGFPRDMSGVDTWNKKMRDKAVLEYVIFFDAWSGGYGEIEEPKCETRKFRNPFKKRTINTSTNGLKLRLDGIMQNMHEILLHYEAEGKLKAIDINSEKSPKEVFRQVRKVLK